MIKIRRFNKSDAEKARCLIIKVFYEFIAEGCTSYGIEEFEKFHTIEKLLQRSEDYVFVAEADEKIVGIIGNKEDRIYNLFVDRKYHGQNVASLLLFKIEKIAVKAGYKKLKVRASLFAVGFYLKRGFKKSTGIMNVRGMVFQPMVKILQKQI